MKIKINVQMTIKPMYEFLLYHTYGNIGGIAGVILGVICLVAGISGLTVGGHSRAILMLFLGFMLVVANPIMLWTKAAKQVKTTAMFKEPIAYELSEDGVHISQNEESFSVVWDEVAKVVETKNTIIIYISRIRAFVLTKESMGDDIGVVYAILKEQLKDRRLKIK